MPVCKKCHNYVMKFPCPHCGSDLSLDDREKGEIQPIVPVELQGSFAEPPPPSYADSDPKRSSTPLKSPKPMGKSIDSPISSTRKSKATLRSQSATPASSTDGTSALMTAALEKRLSMIEMSLKSTQKEVADLTKTHKVMEKVLIEISKEMLKLRKS